jgi:hypothetical protein
MPGSIGLLRLTLHVILRVNHFTKSQIWLTIKASHRKITIFVYIGPLCTSLNQTNKDTANAAQELTK